jgi:galactokinase
MRLWKVTPDGNCLFSAATVCVLYTGDDICEDSIREHALQLREDVVKFMKQHKDSFVPFMTHDFEEYMREIEKPHTWGGEAELLAIANVMNRQVHVYTENNGVLVKFCEYGDKRADAISLFFKSRHYNALLP